MKTIYDKIYAEHETEPFIRETETNFGQYHSGLVGWKFKPDNSLKELTEFSSENI